MRIRLGITALSVAALAALSGTSAAFAAPASHPGAVAAAPQRGNDGHNGDRDGHNGDRGRNDGGRRDDGRQPQATHGDHRDHRNSDHGGWYGRGWDHRSGTWYGWSWEQQCEWAWYNDPAWYNQYCG